jgi:putative transposase
MRCTLPNLPEALAINRGSVYYQTQPVSEENLLLMRMFGDLHLEVPFAGNRVLRCLLRLKSIRIGRRRVRSLMRCMEIEALYLKPVTSRKHPQHTVYPYLLRQLAITRPNRFGPWISPSSPWHGVLSI